ncbi:MAG: ribosome maturation factor RimM [Aphanothece sp. CMT-3BRIN-NPC111]|jgi:16S rRNA processing protein RimM|nr:ribosome maturation factor RimM [Aphanothece sp. CMT-3BRIN-NPC111]
MSNQEINSKLKTQNSKLEDGWLEIGKIVAAQGLDGDVRVYPDSDFPERFEQPGRRWILRPGETKPQPIELLSGRYIPGKGLYVLEFAGVEDRDQAEALRGCRLFVPESDRPALGEDEYHILDLIGLEVFNQLTGEILGVVADIIPAGNDLLVVSCPSLGLPPQDAVVSDERQDIKDKGKKKKDKEVLIPFVKAIVPVVDLQNRRVEITPPPGLLELS